VQAAQDAIITAETEARGNMPNGIGLVKLMGRSSGYIAAYSTLAHGSVDLCLVPEVPLCINGPLSCLEHLESVVEQKGYVGHHHLLRHPSNHPSTHPRNPAQRNLLRPFRHPTTAPPPNRPAPPPGAPPPTRSYAVAVVAEGAGEELLGECAEVDAGGNKKLPQIGEFMKSKIAEHFKSKG